jgi:hypothetical protein
MEGAALGALCAINRMSSSTLPHPIGSMKCFKSSSIKERAMNAQDYIAMTPAERAEMIRERNRRRYCMEGKNMDGSERPIIVKTETIEEKVARLQAKYQEQVAPALAKKL